MQIIQIKQFTNDVPKNQGESHIGITNNRKNNTVIPWPAIQAQNMNLRDTIIHVCQETQQECLSIGNSTNLETTLISIKEDKYINCGITAFADEGKTMHLWNTFLWIDLTNISLSQQGLFSGSFFHFPKLGSLVFPWMLQAIPLNTSLLPCPLPELFCVVYSQEP